LGPCIYFWKEITLSFAISDILGHILVILNGTFSDRLIKLKRLQGRIGEVNYPLISELFNGIIGYYQAREKIRLSRASGTELTSFREESIMRTELIQMMGNVISSLEGSKAIAKREHSLRKRDRISLGR